MTLDAPGQVDLMREGDLHFVNTAGFAAAAPGSVEKEVMPANPAVPVEAAVQGLQDAPMDPAAVQVDVAPAAKAERA